MCWRSDLNRCGSALVVCGGGAVTYQCRHIENHANFTIADDGGTGYGRHFGKQGAERLQVSRQSVNAIETGKYDPSLPLAFRIADLFGLPIEEIFLKD